MAPWLSLLLGLAALLAGAELLVRGAVKLSLQWGLSPLVVGLTVVAFGTSAPELSVSVAAAARGTAGLAVANVVGSNVFNVLFILGVTALIRPVTVRREIVRREVPLVILASAALWWMAAGGGIARPEAAFLLAGLAAYLVWSIRAGRRSPTPAPDLSVIPGPDAPETGPGGDAASGDTDAANREGDGAAEGVLRRVMLPAALVVVGLAALVAGSGWLVEGATALARAMGVGEAVIGLTLVAAGTSLPEVATSAVAAVRGEQDIAVGNVLGSNLFNLLGILGAAGLVAEGGLDVSGRMLSFDLPVMLAAAVACLPLALTGHRIDRIEGGLLALFYAAYVGCLAAEAGGFLVPGAGLALWGFAVPLAALAVAVGGLRVWRERPG